MTTDLKLGYLGFQVKDPQTWESFATEVLGLGIGERGSQGGFALCMDDYAARFFIEPGPADDLFVMGWEAPDGATLEQRWNGSERRRRRAAPGSAEEAARRDVEQLFKLTDPAGIPLELFVGPELAPRLSVQARALGIRHRLAGHGPRRHQRRRARPKPEVLRRRARVPAFGSDRLRDLRPQGGHRVSPREFAPPLDGVR